jgi:hypothetical protein
MVPVNADGLTLIILLLPTTNIILPPGWGVTLESSTRDPSNDTIIAMSDIERE